MTEWNNSPAAGALLPSRVPEGDWTEILSKSKL